MFAGYVVAVRPTGSDSPEGPARRIQFRITEAFRGATRGQLINLFGYNTSCDLFFGAGESWMIYAQPREDGKGFIAGTCSGSRRIEEADDNLKYARLVKSGKPFPGSIRGWVWYAHGDRMVPVAGARVSVSRPGTAQRQISTDADGRYEMPAGRGTYRVTVTVPAGMSTDPLDVMLPDSRACAVADFATEYPGTIVGRVVNASGTPVPNVTVDIVDKNGLTHYLPRGVTDANGRYQITRVSPGEYRPAFPIAWTRGPHGMRANYVYPHSASGDAPAPALKVDGGSLISAADIVLPVTARVAQVHGVVVRPDGQPAAGIKVRAKVDDDDWNVPWTTINADARGRFVFAMIVGERYRVVADPTGEPDRSNPRTTVSSIQ